MLLAVEADVGGGGGQRLLDRGLRAEVDLGQEVLGRLADPLQALAVVGAQDGDAGVHGGAGGFELTGHTGSVLGRPNAANSDPGNAMMSATAPSSMRTTSIASASYSAAPGLHR